MPQRKVDPLGRNHSIVRKPLNRHHVDAVCDYILVHEEKDFFAGDERPSVNHVYYDAYVVLFGSSQAIGMLTRAQEKWDKL